MPNSAFAKPVSWSRVCLLAVALALGGCSSEKPKPVDFPVATPFSKTIQGSGDVVCWCVKRAFLSQGYMLDHSGDSVILAGTKDTQTDEKTNETLRLQTTCVDNKNGTSTIFASASREISKLQKVKTSVSAGISIATITYPTSSDDALRPVSRETIRDPKFYDGFYSLVAGFAADEKTAAKPPVEPARLKPPGGDS